MWTKTSASVFRRRLTVNSGCRAPGSRLPESRQRLSADAVQLQDVESGEVLLFDIAAGEKGPTEPVRLVYSGDVSTLSHAGDAAGQPVVQTGLLPDQAHLLPPAAMMVLRQSVKIRYSAPIPVLLTRYAAQSLYAPARTVEAVPVFIRSILICPDVSARCIPLNH